MRVRPLFAALLAGALVAGCGSSPDPSPADEPPTRTGPGGATLVVELASGDAETVGEAVNAFGFDLLSEVATGEENVVTSPLSVAVLLAMVLAGAGGDTAAAMAEVLHLEDSQDVRVGALLEQLTDTDEVTLAVANALWADPEVPFEDDYLSFVREVFGATVDNADLADPGIVETIDGWVDEQTEGLIDQIADDLGLPSEDTALVLLNAVYFLGEWTTQFDPEETRDRSFTVADGDEVEVPTMHLWEQRFGYAERDGYRMLRLPYGEDGRYGMEVMLPDSDADLTELLSTLDASEWRAATEDLREQSIDELAMPRFTLAWDATLNEPLDQLGMGPALRPDEADFTAMSPAELFLNVVVHKTYLRVDEAGTEAAAVTGGGMDITSAGEELRFLVDRPFAFTISDTETGTVLFLGTVTDPLG